MWNPWREDCLLVPACEYNMVCAASKPHTRLRRDAVQPACTARVEWWQLEWLLRWLQIPCRLHAQTESCWHNTSCCTLERRLPTCWLSCSSSQRMLSQQQLVHSLRLLLLLLLAPTAAAALLQQQLLLVPVAAVAMQVAQAVKARQMQAACRSSRRCWHC